METQQLLKTRLELPFSPSNGYVPKKLCSYESQVFFLRQSELVISASRKKKILFSFFWGGWGGAMNYMSKLMTHLEDQGGDV